MYTTVLVETLESSPVNGSGVTVTFNRYHYNRPTTLIGKIVRQHPKTALVTIPHQGTPPDMHEFSGQDVFLVVATSKTQPLESE